MPTYTEKKQVTENAILWNKVREINNKYSTYKFNNIRCSEICRFEKSTTGAKFGSIDCYDFKKEDMMRTTQRFNYGKFLIEKILENEELFINVIKEHYEIYEIYTEYLKEIYQAFNKFRIFKEFQEPNLSYRGKIAQFFTSNESYRNQKYSDFIDKQRFEKSVLDEKIYKPTFPYITLVLSAKTPWNYYQENQIYTFGNILLCYLQAKNKQGKEAFIKEQRQQVTDNIRYDVLRRDNFRCKICGASANDGVKLEVDHIVPVSKGGKSTMDNLQTLCERCNRGKRDKL